jgi:hypothetical protein
MLRVSGLVQKHLNEGKDLRLQIGKREIVHLSQKEGSLNLEVLPLEKDISGKAKGKKNHILRVEDQILHVEGLDIQETTNPMLFSQMGEQGSLVKDRYQVQESEREVNIKDVSSKWS